MKFNEVLDQIYMLAVEGEINGKMRTKKELRQLIMDSMPHSSQMTKLLLKVRLRDGTWTVMVERWLPYGTRFFEYDYIVPDDRGAEEALIARYYRSDEGWKSAYTLASMK